MGTEVLALFGAAGADVLYILTGQRAGGAAPALTREETALLDNYRNSPDEGKDAIKRTAFALAKSLTPPSRVPKKTRGASC